MSEQYHETIWWKEIIAILGIMAGAMITLAFYILFNENTELRYYLFILYIVLGVVFTYLTINFRKLEISITDENVTVGFAYPKKVIPFNQIEVAMTDKEAKPFVLGFGIRMTRFEKEWVLVYNVIFARRAVAKLKEGKVRYFVFSTKNPEKIAEIINANLNKANADGQSDD